MSEKEKRLDEACDILMKNGQFFVLAEIDDGACSVTHGNPLVIAKKLAPALADFAKHSEPVEGAGAELLIDIFKNAMSRYGEGHCTIVEIRGESDV